MVALRPVIAIIVNIGGTAFWAAIHSYETEKLRERADHPAARLSQAPDVRVPRNALAIISRPLHPMADVPANLGAFGAPGWKGT
jgi:hypothetical protein